MFEAERVAEVERQSRDESDGLDAGNLAHALASRWNVAADARRSPRAASAETITVVVSVCSTRKPGSIASRRSRLRPNRSAPESSTTVSAISPTTRPSRSRLAPPIAPRAALLSESYNAGRVIAERRHDAEADAGDERDERARTSRSARRARRPTRRRHAANRMLRQNEPTQPAHADLRDDEPEHAAERGEQQALGEQLANEARLARAERDAHRDLPLRDRRRE